MRPMSTGTPKLMPRGASSRGDRTTGKAPSSATCSATDQVQTTRRPFRTQLPNQRRHHLLHCPLTVRRTHPLWSTTSTTTTQHTPPYAHRGPPFSYQQRVKVPLAKDRRESHPRSRAPSRPTCATQSHGAAKSARGRHYPGPAQAFRGVGTTPGTDTPAAVVGTLGRPVGLTGTRLSGSCVVGVARRGAVLGRVEAGACLVAVDRVWLPRHRRGCSPPVGRSACCVGWRRWPAQHRGVALIGGDRGDDGPGWAKAG